MRCVHDTSQITAKESRYFFRRNTSKNSRNKRKIWKLEVSSLKWNERNNNGDLHTGINKYKKFYQAIANMVTGKDDVLSYFHPSQILRKNGRPIGKPRHRWHDIIQMDRKKPGLEIAELMYLNTGTGGWRV